MFTVWEALRVPLLVKEKDVLKAVNDGDVNKVKEYLSLGYIDIHVKNTSGQNLLMLAAIKDHIQIFNLLLPYFQEELNEIDEQGRTVFLLAVQFNSLNVIRVLLRLEDVNFNSKTHQGRNALHLAIYNYRSDTLWLLLGSKKIDINVEDEKNQSVLLLTAGHFRGDMPLLKAVLQAGIKIDIEKESVKKISILNYAYSPKPEDHATFYTVLSFLNASQLSSIITKRLNTISNRAKDYRNEVILIRKKIVRFVWGFGKKSRKTEHGVPLPNLPKKPIQAILSYAFLYPNWYEHRFKQDVEDILKKNGILEEPKQVVFSGALNKNKAVCQVTQAMLSLDLRQQDQVKIPKFLTPQK